MSQTKNIYCLSGLGTDDKVFRQLEVEGCGLHVLPWIKEKKGESLRSYALRMAEAIPEKNPVLLGLSFGGMIGIEIEKAIPVDKVIIVSGIKTRAELPPWMRWCGRFQLNKLLPVTSNRFTEKADDRRLGIRSASEKLMVESYRYGADKKHLSWAINEILNWKNTAWNPRNTFHIHGDEDRMFPIERITPTHVIKGGTHIMILNRSEEICRCIKEIAGICS